MSHRGVVTWFNDKRGFGFIKDEAGREVFVHYSEIRRDGFQTLAEGEAVSFEVQDEERGPKAVNVVPEGG
ncbi:MAG: cold shock domain-containing protein [Desulfovibrionaceae bacterium]|nr:cold shock domain-containing protein [Desulfovibrionaceae bacterium]